MLSLTGVDTNTFKAHSTRAAATSKANSLGLRIEEVISQGNWSNESTFERFYNKPIMSGEKIFQKMILGNEEQS